MKNYKKAYTVIILASFIVTGIAATHAENDDDHFTNLKVLPKKTTADEMDRIMYAFERQLGVTCLYCHVAKKNVFPERLDFASDEKPEKKIAREMLKMTLKINKKYFGMKGDEETYQKKKIWCRTCHYGFPVPPHTK